MNKQLISSFQKKKNLEYTNREASSSNSMSSHLYPRWPFVHLKIIP